MILNKAQALHQENLVLKDTLARMQVVQPSDMKEEMDDPSIDTQEEELMRMRYFEALRRQHFEEQLRQMEMRRGDSSAQ